MTLNFCSTETSFCLEFLLDWYLSFFCIKERITVPVLLKQNFCHHKINLFYTVMPCQSCASQGSIAFHFLCPTLFFCIKYAIFCISENPVHNIPMLSICRVFWWILISCWARVLNNCLE